MKSTSKKNYIGGSAKAVVFADGGEIINIDLKLSDINALPVSDRGYVKITVSKRSSPDTYGNTHYVVENTFVPDKSKGAGAKEPAAAGYKAPSVGFGKGEKRPF